MHLPAFLEDAVRSSWLYQGVVSPIRHRLQLQRWVKNDRPIPPPHVVKARNLLTVADLFNLDVLIETGTYKGRMIDAVIGRFKKVYSIEIFVPFAERAKHRFARKPSVSILTGDSAITLPTLLPSVLEPALFWLDGHHCGDGMDTGAPETPVLLEIEHILKLRKGYADAIVIDDARCFNGTRGYPELHAFLSYLRLSFGCTPIVADDSIFIFPSTI